jgi:kynureninase
LMPGLEIRVVPRAQLIEALDETVALLLLTQVHYKTGEIHDMAALTAKAHRVGALTLWDLSHSAGAMPVDLNGSDADFAVGCGYKYLNGGPGAPAFTFVARRHQKAFRSPLTGWMGHAQPFAFDDDYQPAAGMARLLCGTPQVLGMVALDAALGVFADIDMAMIRTKSIALGDLFLRLVTARCADLIPACPLDGEKRGSQVALRHPHGYAIMQALIERGVIGDFRAPDILRFGFTPLYLGYAEVWDAVDRLAQVMETEAWRQSRHAAVSAVT